MRISDWSSDVCSSDLKLDILGKTGRGKRLARGAAAEDGRNLVLQLAVGSTCRARLRRRPPLQSLDDGAGAEQVLDEIGRATCRERVCQYVSISVVAV